MATRPPANAALLQEVDEAVRKEELNAIARRYGAIIVAVLVAGLLAFGGYLFWQDRQRAAAGEQAEALVAAFDKLKSGQPKAAETALGKIAADGPAAYRAAASIQLANMKSETGDIKAAATLLGKLAQDESVDPALRDLALVRQTALEFDSIKPELVIARMAPILARKDPVSAWFPSAAELTAVAHYHAGRFKQAGELYARIAQTKDIPGPLQSRAVQMAGMLGVDAVEDRADTSAKKDQQNEK